MSDVFICYPTCTHHQLKITVGLTINKKDTIIMEVTLPPNQSTSPYAIKIMVKFLKIVYIGMGKYCNAFDPVYIMPTKKTTIGYHFLAASYSIS